LEEAIHSAYKSLMDLFHLLPEIMQKKCFYVIQIALLPSSNHSQKQQQHKPLEDCVVEKTGRKHLRMEDNVRSVFIVRKFAF
jgi:hypothetical protein